MSKEKQIEEMAKALNEATFGVNTHTLADHLKPETINKVAEYLYNAGYRKQSEPISCCHEKGVEWISVDERLPEKHKAVLVSFDGYVHIDFICSRGVWYDHDHNLVTHWMPLPEPPMMKGE